MDLIDYALKYRANYQKAKPFPHVVIDNLFNVNILTDVLDEFPDLRKEDTKEFNQPIYQFKKYATKRGERLLGENSKTFLRYLNSSDFLDFLGVISSIERPLIPDPHFKGGGLHEIKRGGQLAIHADFCKHKGTLLDRRLNVLIYLNKDWQEEYGGHLELWDKEMTTCIQKILPIFNRLVIFSTTDFSYHGHPDPLNCPESRSRKSLALYYYTNGRPKEEIRSRDANQSTIFKSRPGEMHL